MDINRRDFLQKAGLLTAGSLLFQEGLAQSPEFDVSKAHLKSFGIQLWSVRDVMAKDPKGTLKALAADGYKYIESFSHSGFSIFWGMTAKEFKAYMSSVGLTMYSAHCDGAFTFDLSKRDEFKALCDDAAGIGMKYLLNSYVGDKAKTLDDFKRIADLFNECGEICHKAGLQYGYHNHHYSFQAIDGVIPQTIFLDRCDPKNVVFELDLYWLKMAGQDPIHWLKKYPNRFKLVHVKDSYSKARVEEINRTEKVDPNFPFNSSCILGEGVIDYPKILNVAKKHGTEYFIVEQERWDNTTPMAAAKADAKYLKNLVLR